MAGHSKWSNIKHRKAGQDAKKAKVFTKLIRELTVSARDGGGSVEDNPGLRNLVDKPSGANAKRHDGARNCPGCRWSRWCIIGVAGL